MDKVPLFGLHYVLLPFRPEVGSSMDRVYQVTSALLISLQVNPLSMIIHKTSVRYKTHLYELKM